MAELGREGRHAFCEKVPSVEGYAVGLRNCWIEIRLHGVDGFRNEIQSEESVGVEIVEQS